MAIRTQCNPINSVLWIVIRRKNKDMEYYPSKPQWSVAHEFWVCKLDAILPIQISD